jgi:hypothetical protein
MFTKCWFRRFRLFSFIVLVLSVTGIQTRLARADHATSACAAIKR